MKKTLLALVILVVLFVCVIPAHAQDGGDRIFDWEIVEKDYELQRIFVRFYGPVPECCDMWITINDTTRIMGFAPPYSLGFDDLSIGDWIRVNLNLNGMTTTDTKIILMGPKVW